MTPSSSTRGRSRTGGRRRSRSSHSEELIVNRGRKLRVQMFGDEYPIPDAPFDFEFLGLVRPERLAWTYSEATVGIALSMTNASLVPQDMRACGLPCIELAGGAAEASYGDSGGVMFASFDPVSVADRVESAPERSGVSAAAAATRGSRRRARDPGRARVSRSKRTSAPRFASAAEFHCGASSEESVSCSLRRARS